jgi:hypothetical protein
MGTGIFSCRFVCDDSAGLGIGQRIMGIIVNAEMFPKAGKGMGFQFWSGGTGQCKDNRKREQ